MTDDKYYALYQDGYSAPIGAIKEGLISVTEDLSTALGRRFYVKPVTLDEAKGIRGRLTGNESLDQMLEKFKEQHKK